MKPVLVISSVKQLVKFERFTQYIIMFYGINADRNLYPDTVPYEITGNYCGCYMFFFFVVMKLLIAVLACIVVGAIAQSKQLKSIDFLLNLTQCLNK